MHFDLIEFIVQIVKSQHTFYLIEIIVFITKGQDQQEDWTTNFMGAGSLAVGYKIKVFL